MFDRFVKDLHGDNSSVRIEGLSINSYSAVVKKGFVYLGKDADVCNAVDVVSRMLKGTFDNNIHSLVESLQWFPNIRLTLALLVSVWVTEEGIYINNTSKIKTDIDRGYTGFIGFRSSMPVFKGSVELRHDFVVLMRKYRKSLLSVMCGDNHICLEFEDFYVVCMGLLKDEAILNGLRLSFKD